MSIYVEMKSKANSNKRQEGISFSIHITKQQPSGNQSIPFQNIVLIKPKT